MQLAARQLGTQLTWRPAWSVRKRVQVDPPVVVEPAALTTVQLAKRSGGPQDRALYTCGCGCAWTAAVSTTVGCPHCGTEQAW